MSHIHFRPHPKEPHNVEHLLFVEGAFNCELTKMQEVLDQNLTHPAVASHLRDQVNWLRQQMNWYLDQGPLEHLVKQYNWVAKSVNQDLELNGDEEIALFKS